jgi:hypothetical protein
VLGIFEIGSHELFAQVGLEPQAMGAQLSVIILIWKYFLLSKIS